MVLDGTEPRTPTDKAGTVIARQQEITALDKNQHSHIPTLIDEMTTGTIGRREFLRKATLLGVSAAAAYSLAGLPVPNGAARAEDMPKGGNLRIGMEGGAPLKDYRKQIRAERAAKLACEVHRAGSLGEQFARQDA